MRMQHRVTGVVLDVPESAVEDYSALGYREAEATPKAAPQRRRRTKAAEAESDSE